MAEEINKTYTSNSLYNDSTGVIAFAEQLKQELINWANYHHVTEELGPNYRPDTQSALNNLFLSVYERFLTFLNDADATEEAINTWKEIERFLADYTDEKTLAEIVAELNTNIESRLTVPLESTTGSSTTSTMTQKAITETIDASKTFTTGEKVDNVGIDDEPTAGSNNLVKSGGVYEEVSQLVREKVEILPGVNLYDKDNLYSGTFLSDGTLYIGTDHYHTDYIKVVPDTDYCLSNPSTLPLETYARYYMFYKEDKTLCSTPSVIGTEQSLIVLHTPNDCAFVRLSVVKPRDLMMFNLGTTRPTTFTPYNPIGGYPANILNGSITEEKLADNSVSTNKIADNSVSTSKIIDKSINQSKVNDAVYAILTSSAAVSGYKITVDSVPAYRSITPQYFFPIPAGTTIKNNGVDVALATNSSLLNRVNISNGKTVTVSNDMNYIQTLGTSGNVELVIVGVYDKIADNAVTTSKIADNAVTTSKIANNAVTLSKIAFTETDDNLVNPEKLVVGYLDSSGNIQVIGTYKTTDFINVVPGSVYYLKPSGSQFNNMVARFVCLYDSNKNYITETYTQNIYQITIPSGAAYLRASYYQNWWGYEQVTKDSIREYQQYVEYISTDVIKPIGTSKIQDGAITNDKLSPGLIIPIRPIPFNRLSINGDVADAIYTTDPVQVIKNACVTAIINGNIDSNGVAVGLGYNESVSSKRTLYAHWLIVKPTDVELHRYNGTNDVLVNTYTHGLTLTDKTFVYIKKADGNNLNATFKISTDLGEVFEQSISDWYGEGKPFVQNFGNTEISAIVSLMPMDLTKKVWLFGDSYCGFWNANRWIYYLMADGNVSYLLNALAGEAASGAYKDLETLLTTGALPTYLVWCLGMNGPADTYDSGTGTYVINATQKSYVDAVVEKCTLKKIIPIFATIPSVPSGRHTGYNEYIKSLGVRYIDFDAAVGAQPDGTWNTGLLSSDNVHPTESGAKVLYAQALVDCPELTIKE